MKWSDEQTALLRKYILQGMTFKQVAELFGVTRSTIAGKWSRIRGVRKEAPRSRNVKARSKVAPDGSYGKGKRLADIGRCQCRYPTGYKRGHLFCAAACEGTFCEKHAAMVYVPTSDADAYANKMGWFS